MVYLYLVIDAAVIALGIILINKIIASRRRERPISTVRPNMEVFRNPDFLTNMRSNSGQQLQEKQGWTTMIDRLRTEPGIQAASPAAMTPTETSEIMVEQDAAQRLMDDGNDMLRQRLRTHDGELTSYVNM